MLEKTIEKAPAPVEPGPSSRQGWPVAWLMRSRVAVSVTPGVLSVALDREPRFACTIRHCGDGDGIHLRIYDHGHSRSPTQV